MKKKQIVLDLETTGINLIDQHYIGHKIIEIGAIEIKNRKITNNIFHYYINPKRKIDKKAYKIHGIKNSFLINKPTFNEISNKLINYIKNSELIIHNASFDISFIENELKTIKHNIIKIKNICQITDTLSIARKMFPGKKNDLNSLKERYKINSFTREKHGALIDAKLLALIFLNMTKKQININFNDKKIKKIQKNTKKNTKILFANKKEKKTHIKYLNFINKQKIFKKK